MCIMYNSVMNQTLTHKRVNITLPKETLGLIDELTKKGERSRFLDEAVRFYVCRQGRSKLRRLMRAGAVKRAKRDLELAGDWFNVEEEIWPKGSKE